MKTAERKQVERKRPERKTADWESFDWRAEQKNAKRKNLKSPFSGRMGSLLVGAVGAMMMTIAATPQEAHADGNFGLGVIAGEPTRSVCVFLSVSPTSSRTRRSTSSSRSRRS